MDVEVVRSRPCSIPNDTEYDMVPDIPRKLQSKPRLNIAWRPLGDFLPASAWCGDGHREPKGMATHDATAIVAETAPTIGIVLDAADESNKKRMTTGQNKPPNRGPEDAKTTCRETRDSRP